MAWSWSVDTVAPVIIDLDGPPPATIDPDAVLTFDANEPATFECQLNDSSDELQLENRPPGLRAVPDDSYTFNVRSPTSPATSARIAARSWVLGTDPPETVIDSGPDALVNTSDATITFSSPDAGVTYECRLGAEDFAPCNSPRTFNGLGDDSYTFAVRAVNAGRLADPTPASTTWTVDTIAPTVAIDSGPSGTVGVGPATFTFLRGGGSPVLLTRWWRSRGVHLGRATGVLAGTSHTFSACVRNRTLRATPVRPCHRHGWSMRWHPLFNTAAGGLRGSPAMPRSGTPCGRRDGVGAVQHRRSGVRELRADPRAR
ncbi:MAG: hypothetical protein M9922_04190 [Microthrixaceae bacterium]|nr:hypothetical protein [Microthrixaceae bacterium]